MAKVKEQDQDIKTLKDQQQLNEEEIDDMQGRVDELESRVKALEKPHRRASKRIEEKKRLAHSANHTKTNPLHFLRRKK
jgi:chaperonin cofactor prefoldin